MCGRFVRTSPREVLAQDLGVTQFADVDLGPRYNIAPSQMVEGILRDAGGKRLTPLRWGLATSSTKPPPINARAETVATMPLYRDAFRQRRCLIVADGFYEWRKQEAGKTPFFIHLASGRPFTFAGIWSPDRNEDPARPPTCAILTCPPNPLVARLHDRMPVILPPSARDAWLDPRTRDLDLRRLLAPLPAEEMEAYEVSTFVNAAKNDSAECLRRVGG